MPSQPPRRRSTAASCSATSTSARAWTGSPPRSAKGCDGPRALDLRRSGARVPRAARQRAGEACGRRACGSTPTSAACPTSRRWRGWRSSRCALLSFGWRPSGSRVLLEASVARTPVVVGNDSAVGRLVERHGLGRHSRPRRPGGAARGDPRDGGRPRGERTLRREPAPLRRGAARRALPGRGARGVRPERMHEANGLHPHPARRRAPRPARWRRSKRRSRGRRW